MNESGNKKVDFLKCMMRYYVDLGTQRKHYQFFECSNSQSLLVDAKGRIRMGEHELEGKLF